MALMDTLKDDLNKDIMARIWKPLDLSLACGITRKRKNSIYYQSHFRGAWIIVRSDNDTRKVLIKLWKSKKYLIAITPSGLQFDTDAPRKLMETLVKVFPI